MSTIYVILVLNYHHFLDTEMYSRIQDDGHCVVLYDLCGDEIYYDETDGYFSPYQYQRASAPVTTSDVLLQPMVAR